MLQADYSKVTAEWVRQSLAGGWELYSDDLPMNFIGHAYHGSLAFNAARSSGLTFWESLPAPALNSLLWEIAGDAELPLINDVVISSSSGVIFGEAFHRISALLWDGPPPSSVNSLLAALVKPVGALNRRMIGERRFRTREDAPPAYEGNFRFAGQLARGGLLGRASAAHGVIGVEFTFGLNRSRRSRRSRRCRRSRCAPNRRPAAAGRQHPPAGSARRLAPHRWSALGRIGLFTSHSFDGGNGFRSAGSALGPGATVSLRVAGAASLRIWALAAPVLLCGYRNERPGRRSEPPGRARAGVSDGTGRARNARTRARLARPWPAAGVRRNRVARRSLDRRLSGHSARRQRRRAHPRSPRGGRPRAARRQLGPRNRTGGLGLRRAALLAQSLRERRPLRTCSLSPFPRR